MPIKKTSAFQPGSVNTVETKTADLKTSAGCCHSLFKSYGQTKNFGCALARVFCGILLVYLIFYIGTLINNNLKQNHYIGLAPKQERTISVAGYGKINGSNDIAVTTIGYTNTSTDIGQAQAVNKKVMDAIMADLKKMKIDEKDMQSNYSIFPAYDYTNSGKQFLGYQVTNKLTVKIRNLNNVQNILSLAGKYSVNQISGLSFTMDDNDNLKSQARIKALSDANKKAKVIAHYLGVNLGQAVSYGEYESSKGGYYPVANSLAEGLGRGSEISSIAGGSSDVEMNVNVVYEIK